MRGNRECYIVWDVWLAADGTACSEESEPIFAAAAAPAQSLRPIDSGCFLVPSTRARTKFSCRIRLSNEKKVTHLVGLSSPAPKSFAELYLFDCWGIS